MKLRTNAGSDRLLLVNFWATWCAPRVDEFPEIEKMVRMYVAKRPLDIVTVSINHPEEKRFVQNFLENSTRSAAISSSVETILPMP
jgi:thiol-disulfide isomerase/thioredoxin